MRNLLLAGLLTVVCGLADAQTVVEMPSDDELLRTVVTNLRSSWKCTSAKPIVPTFWCRDEPTITSALGQTALRLWQAKTACGLSEAEADSLLSAVLIDGSRCRNDDSNCTMANIRLLRSGLDDDLAGVASKKACTNVKWRLERLQEDRAREAAISLFWSCVGAAVRTIDDGISPADSVATGVFGACRQTLVTPGPNSPVENPLMQAAVMPQIIARVLAERARKKASPPPTRKPRQVLAPTV